LVVWEFVVLFFELDYCCCFFFKESVAGRVGLFVFFLNIFFGAFSRYPFQSFVPNPGTKGFPLHTSGANWRSNQG
jgi:hypothetical protein